MSLRPEIMGFSLATLKALLGSRNSKALTSLLETATEALGDQDPEPVRKILSRAILEGAPFPDLETEGENHVTAMILLGAHGQAGTATDSNIWKASAFDDLWDEIGEQLPPKAAPLLQGLQSGRPMLGRRIASSWSTYAWLSRTELDLLRRVLEIIGRKQPDPTSDGFLADLLR